MHLQGQQVQLVFLVLVLLLVLVVVLLLLHHEGGRGVSLLGHVDHLLDMRENGVLFQLK